MAIYTHLDVEGAPTSFWFTVVGTGGAAAGSTDTLIVIDNTDATLTLQLGSGFQYAGADVTAGSITQVQRTDATQTVVYDTITGISISASALFDLTALEINPFIFKGNDILNGWSKKDYLAGFAGNDKIFGNGGKDVLLGGRGNDKLNGGDAIDILVGEAGKDTLTGGDARDIFMFVFAEESRRGAGDVITDFHRGNNATGDDIDLHFMDAKSGTVANDKFSFIGKAAFHGVEGELRYKVVGGNALVEGDTDGNGAADFQILVRGLTTLTGTDFLL